MSLSSKSQEKHGYSKTLTEYKSEKIQEEEAKREAQREVIIDKDGNKIVTELAPPDCRFATEDYRYIDLNQIKGRDFKRCDYDSFSKYSSIKLLAFKDHFKLSIAMRMYRKQLLPIFTSQNICNHLIAKQIILD